ncbi:MAG: prolyl oligopeptidase family serine peptidase [Candidatus Lokiarchaeota archaeon]|nr:prolyl oligopeptidase family serine peptidase [Candidatus Lokiarchaeota archaeon]
MLHPVVGYMTGHDYPETRKEDIVETIHGVEVSDPYRWLENTDDPEVQDWIKKQMEFSKKVIESYGDQEPIKERLRELSLFDAMSTKPVVIRKTDSGFRFFYLFRYKDDHQMRLCYQDGFDGERITLVNPIDIDPDGTVQIDWFSPSWDGKLVAYGYSEGGNELSNLRIMHVGDMIHLSDTIEGLRLASAVWLHDSSGLYYVYNSFQPECAGRFAGSVFYHQIGTSSDVDICVLSGKGRPLEMVSISGSPSSNLICIKRQRAKGSDLLVSKYKLLESPKLNPILFQEESPSLVVHLHNGILYVLNHIRASLGEIITYDLTNWDGMNPPDSKILLEEREYLIHDMIPFGSSVIFVELHDASSLLCKMDIETKKIDTLLGQNQFIRILSLSSIEQTNVFLCCMNTFHSPHEQLLFHKDTGFSSFFRPNVHIDSDDFVTKQIWFSSKDGTNIPMFLMHHKNLDLTNSHPTVISGYGGFGESQMPVYSPLHIVWNIFGGIFIVVNLRGGGEYGERWHSQGIRERKQNVIDDLVSSAEWISEHSLSNRNMIGIRGGSNGGLIVAAAVIQRPDLFSSVFSMYPLTDMIRFTIDEISQYWIPEYGNPANSEDFKVLISYSPYHNVSNSSHYPSALFFVAANDARVNPMHSLKMIAKLQNTCQGGLDDNQIILWWDEESGHLGGKTMEDWINLWSLEIVFHASQLGLTIEIKK